jgi:GNAT superfamily N-acetyltransferase
MNVNLRPGCADDAEPCGVICYAAFKAISGQHNFPPDFPVPDMAVGLMGMLFQRPDVYSVVAELDGRVVGSNCLWESDTIAGVGPITVDPNVQNGKVGRALMQNVLDRAEQRKFVGVRLVQAAYHNRSLSLYAKLGFDTQEPLSCIQGAALNMKISGYAVRPATEADCAACNALCLRIHGHTRANELRDAIRQGNARVVEHDGGITGYATLVGFFGHAVGTSNQELKALIGAAPDFPGPGFLLPTRNTEMLRWCLQQGLRVVQPMTLMSLGLYNQPAGVFMPSVLF